MSLIGDIVTSIVKGAVTKAVQGFVTKGQITPAQGVELVDGVMVEIQLGLEIYEASQAKAADAPG